MPSSTELRIAIIGCGAVTEIAHLPVSQTLSNAKVTLLVDTNPARSAPLAAKFAVPRVATDFHQALDTFDAAIVALPHALHAPVSIALLEKGKSVLVEKPMANTVAECEAMLAAAQRSGAILAVGLMRRYLWAHQLAHRMITTGGLGRIIGFNAEEGFIYNWPVASDFFFRKDTAGGGVLIDTGAHTLDCLLHWLGPYRKVEYFDDAEGGVEANCILHLTLESGVTGTIELSRTRTLRGTALIHGERGTLEIMLPSNGVWFHHCDLRFGGPVAPASNPNSIQSYLDIMSEQLQDFVAACLTGTTPLVEGRSALASIALIEECYRTQKPWVLPWEHPAATD